MSAAAQPRSYAPAPRADGASSGAEHAPSRTRAAAAPRLRLVRAPQTTRTRVPFVLLCIAILVAALLGALFLNTSMAGGSYRAHGLQSELAGLARTKQDLDTQLQTHMAPGQLAASARTLGMVPAPKLAFLRLADGAILGEPTPAQAGG